MAAEMSKAAAAASVRRDKPQTSQASADDALLCIFCNETFDDKPTLQEHFRQHGEQKKPIKLTNSVERKNGKLLIKCDFCEEVLESVSLAIQHQFRKHKDMNNKYFCSWCGKQFPISYTYREHVRLHRKDELKTLKGLFKCAECNITFYNSKAMKYHHNSVHTVHKLFRKNTLVPPPSKKIYVDHMGDMQSVYYCQYCGKEYILKFNLQSHIEKVHDKEIAQIPPTDFIQCKLCDAYFYTEKAYDYHSSYHTPSDVYVSSEDMRAHVVTKVDQEYDARRVRPCSTEQQKILCITQTRRRQKLALVNDMSDFSPPPSDSSDSEPEFLDEKPKQEESKNPSTVDELFKMYDEDECEAKATEPSDSEEKPSEVKLSVSVEDDKRTTGESSESKNEFQNVKNLEIKYMTKDEIDKMKSKGLLRLAPKPKDFKNIKKIHIVAKPPASIDETSDAVSEESALVENIGVNKGGGTIKTFFNRKRKFPNLTNP